MNFSKHGVKLFNNKGELFAKGFYNGNFFILLINISQKVSMNIRKREEDETEHLSRKNKKQKLSKMKMIFWLCLKK